MEKRHIKTWCFLCVILLVGLILLVLDREFVAPLQQKEFSTVVTARDGTPLRAFADKKGVWRYPATLNEISELYIQALLTYEDRWFYYHPGVNPVSMVRAFFQNMAAGRVISGGSTLTMQVARMIHPIDRTLWGKCIQMFRAVQLEWHYSKDEILSAYINLVPFGANIEGVQTAAFSWLGKQALELSYAEAALLAVLPQAPSFNRPDRHPHRAQKARDKVLDRMVRFNIWPKKIAAAAKKEPILANRFIPPVIAPLAARRLKKQFPQLSHIRTTIDVDLQLHVQDLVKAYTATLGKHQSAAVLVVNHKTLETHVYVGSADFASRSGKGHVDMVGAVRSPGSTLKPFLYGLAIDQGLIHSHSMLLDTPRYQKEYDPGNFTKGFSGPVTMADALRLSLNVTAVRVLDILGPRLFYDRLVNSGVRLSLPGKPNLSMILGGVGIDLESLVTLYTALAGDGIAKRPVLVEGSHVQKRYLMSEGAAWIIRHILSQPVPGFEGVSRFTGTTPMAWKTGTSYGFRDAWAIGVLGDYVAGVWVGRPDGSPSVGQYGAVTALPLLNRVFDSLPVPDAAIPQPENVTQQTICWPLGQKVKIKDGNCHIRHQAWILNNKIPLTLIGKKDTFSPLFKTFWIDDLGKRATPACGGIKKIGVATWPSEAEPFIPVSWHQKRLIPPPSAQCPELPQVSGRPLQITSIYNNTVLTHPESDSQSAAIPLSVLGSHGRTYWFLNREPVAVLPAGSSGTLPMPGPGSYQISAADDAGNFDIVTFTVIRME